VEVRPEDALVSRVCHDLITPLNAIGIGMEAYRTSLDPSLVDMIMESVGQANAVLKFMRELHSAKPESFCYTIPSLKELIANFLGDRIAFNLTASVAKIPPVIGKITMYNALMAKEIMPFGGTITEDIAGNKISVHCQGRSITVPNMNQDIEPDHKNIFRIGLMDLLRKSNATVNISATDDGIMITENVISWAD
jgi:hypothetical protein